MSRDGKRRTSVAFLAYPGMGAQELTAAYGLLRGMEMARHRLFLVSDTLAPVATDVPMKVTPTTTLDVMPHPGVVVVTGGGDAAPLELLGDAARLEWLRRACASAARVVAIGAGAVPLAAVGALDGRAVATHWAYAPLLEAFGVEVVGARLHIDGPVASSAGGSGAADLALVLVGRSVSVAAARVAQLFAEYDVDPAQNEPAMAPIRDANRLGRRIAERRAVIRSAVAPWPALWSAASELALLAAKEVSA